jgi:catechol 2,3-dioxygenase-like lactoylglutathione lyase family enzyme
MTIVGLHHAGLCVANLERSIAFYAEVFGLELAERLSFAGEEIAFLWVGSARLELIETTAGRRPTGVVDHVALEVHELDMLLERLRARGVTLLDAAPVPVPPLGARILFCSGPDGERIELFEYH